MKKSGVKKDGWQSTERERKSGIIGQREKQQTIGLASWGSTNGIERDKHDVMEKVVCAK